MGFGPSSLGAYSVERGIVAGVQYAKLLRNSAVPQPVRDPVSRNRLAAGEERLRRSQAGLERAAPLSRHCPRTQLTSFSAPFATCTLPRH
jgi:hypothetical protein